MLSEADIRGWNELEEAAEKAGGYLAYYPGKKVVQEYDYRAMSRYCREKGIKPMDLPEEERKQFEFDPPLVFPRDKRITGVDE